MTSQSLTFFYSVAELHRAGPSPQATISPLPQATRAMGFWASAEEFSSTFLWGYLSQKLMADVMATMTEDF
jgi:hypothetical protein